MARLNQDVYGASAPERGWVPAPSYLLRRDRILKLLRPLPPGELLEVGCGAGALLNDLSYRGFRCTALESSPRAAELARYINRGNTNVRIQEQPSDDWYGKFEYILAFEVLEHIQDDTAALLQWMHWLRPAGRLIISVPAHMSRWTASDVWAGHYRRYERPGLRHLLEACGFSISHWECYGFPLKNIIEPMRARYHSGQLLIASQEQLSVEPKTKNTARSGVERTLETKLYRLQVSWVGLGLMRIAFTLQSWSVAKEWGTGYLVAATLREKG